MGIYNASQELEGLKTDIHTFEIKNEAMKEQLANDLITNLGSSIKETLNNPIKLTRFDMFKYKIKKIFNTLIEIL